MRFQILACLLALPWFSSPAFAADKPLSFEIDQLTALTGPKEFLYMQSRGALIPGKTPRVLVTTQQTERVGSHGYRDMFQIETRDGGKTWSKPRVITSLKRKRTKAGYDFVVGDFCPQWHAATRVVLGTGKTFGFRGGTKEDKSLERVSYSVYSPQAGTWSGLQILKLPETDHKGKPILEPNSGCHQRHDLPNGDILLPIRYRNTTSNRYYTTIVALCKFDGRTLSYVKHGSEHTRRKGRGLYEPSVAEYAGRYFLTMRADDTAFVARGTDGLNYDKHIEWKFDDGKSLGSYNTQQHWVVHSDGLYLAYTRKGANNDHIMRHRAPLFIARVDPDRLCVLRDTELVLLPENHATLGNFGVIDVSPRETWVITSEGLYRGKRRNDRNKVLIARIRWSRANKRVAKASRQR